MADTRANKSSNPRIEINRSQARCFLLAHHYLLPPHSLNGKTGIMEYIKRVGCIQFDPINVVGRNPDLVLQSRIGYYRPELLQELLYQDRSILDGWDKMASIYPSSDWPYFSRHRAYMKERRGDPGSPAMQIAEDVIAEIRQRGPLASIDFAHDERIEWSWGQNSRLVRATLEVLYSQGILGIHHRVHSRRYFDLIERLLPGDLLEATDINQSEQAYHDWHVYRRVGSMGIADPGAGDYWLGMLGVKSPQRLAAIERLLDKGQLAALEIKDLPGKKFYIQSRDLAHLSEINGYPERFWMAAFIAPLDNLIWNRNLIKLLFDFDYTWEVYKPANKRDYGYYVLPVLYGDRFVARFEPSFDKRNRALIIKNWWWEPGAQLDDAMEAAIIKTMREFCGYLDVESYSLGAEMRTDPEYVWLADCL